MRRIVDAIAETARGGAQLAVFPECAISGYCFASLDEARPFAQPIPGPAIEQLAKACRKADSFAVVGLLEADGERMFNACVLVGPQGLVGSYRKLHLPMLGIDQFTNARRSACGCLAGRPRLFGNEHLLRWLVSGAFAGDGARRRRVDCVADEFGRRLLTALPAIQYTRGRWKTRSYYMSVNRVGTERGFRFIGLSMICDTDGHTLAEAPYDEEAILYAEIDPAKARNKHLVRVPGKHELHRWRDRRPEMYGRLVEPVGDGLR